MDRADRFGHLTTDSARSFLGGQQS